VEIDVHMVERAIPPLRAVLAHLAASAQAAGRRRAREARAA
jgi:hypothetical protein